jgi:HEAT repeat protein
MTTFELEKEVKEKLYRAFAAGVITPDELESLPVRLGCLALNFFDAEQDYVTDANLALSWLLYRRLEPPRYRRHSQPSVITLDTPPLRISQEEQNQANRLLRLAVELGFLVKEDDALGFECEEYQEYFCAVYCMYYPINNDILNRIPSTIWYLWCDLDLDLAEKVWQFVKDGNEDEEYEAGSLLLNVSDNGLWRDKSLWSQISSEEIATLLIEGLKDPDTYIRERAASILESMRNPRSVESYLEALHDTNPHVRWCAAIGLGNMEEKRAVPGLIKLLDDEDGYVRQRAVYALSYIRDPAAVEPLIDTLLNDEYAGAVAAWVIGHFKDNRAVEPLIEVLDEDWAELREHAAESLGEIGDKQAIEPLALLLNDENENVGAMAARALLMMDDNRGFQLMTDYIEKAAKHSNKYQPRASKIVEVLGNSGDARAVKPLLDALPTTKYILRNRIITALGKLGNPLAIEPLVKLLDNSEPVTRARAAQALGQLAAEMALPKLVELAKHDKSDPVFRVKEAALEAIDQIQKAVEKRKNFPNLLPEAWQN